MNTESDVPNRDEVISLIELLGRRGSGGGTTANANLTNLLQFTVAAPFTQPGTLVETSVTLTSVESSLLSQLTTGQNVYVQGGGRYVFQSAVGNTALLVNPGDALNAPGGSTVPAGGNASAVNLQPYAGDEVLAYPLGVATDDWPRVISLLRDAAPAGKIIALQAGTFLYDTTLFSSSNFTLSLVDRARITCTPETVIELTSGTTISAPLFIGESSGEPTFDLMLLGTFPPTAQGAMTITLDTTHDSGAPIPAPGQWLVLASPANSTTANTWWYQRKVVSITPAGTNLYTVVLDRGLPRGYTFTATEPGQVPGNQVYAGYLSAEGINMDGNYASMSASVNLLTVINVRDLNVGNLIVDGLALGYPSQNGVNLFTLELGSYRSRVHDVRIDLSGNPGAGYQANGVLLEGAEDCFAENVSVIGCNFGFAITDSVNSGIINCRASNSGNCGVIFNNGSGTLAYDGTDGCVECYAINCTFDGNLTGVYDLVSGSIANTGLTLTDITCDNNTVGFYLQSPGIKGANLAANNSSNVGFALFCPASTFDNVNLVGNAINLGTTPGCVGTVISNLSMQRNSAYQYGININGGNLTIHNLTSYDTFAGTDVTNGLIAVIAGELTIDGGFIGGAGASLPANAFYIADGGSLNASNMTINTSNLLLFTDGAEVVRLSHIAFTTTGTQGLYLSAGSTVWLDDVTGLPATNILVGVCYTSRPIQTTAGVWTNTAALVAGLWAIPWPQVTGSNTVDVTRVSVGGTPGFLTVVAPTSGQFSVSSASFLVSGLTLNVTPSPGGGSAATIAFGSNQTAAQAAATINAQFTLAGTKAVASVVGDGTYLYIAPTAAGVALAMTGSAAAVFAFTPTKGLVIASSSATDTSTVSFTIT